MQSSIYFEQFSYADASAPFFSFVCCCWWRTDNPPFGTFFPLPSSCLSVSLAPFGISLHFRVHISLIQFRKLLHSSLIDILDDGNGNGTNVSMLNTIPLCLALALALFLLFNVKDWILLLLYVNISIQTLNIAYLCSTHTHIYTYTHIRLKSGWERGKDEKECGRRQSGSELRSKKKKKENKKSSVIARPRSFWFSFVCIAFDTVR